MRRIRKSIAELGNNKWRAHPMYGDCAARTSPMWTGLWHAFVETPRNSAHPAARCFNKAPVATINRATIRSIGRGAIAIMGRGRMIATMARGRMVAIIVPDLTKTTNRLAHSYGILALQARGTSASCQGGYSPLKASSNHSTARYLERRLREGAASSEGNELPEQM